MALILLHDVTNYFGVWLLVKELPARAEAWGVMPVAAMLRLEIHRKTF